MDKLYKNFYKKAKAIYKNDKSGHDIKHINKCLNFANKIQKQEGGNSFIITVSILFHDVHRIMSNKQNKYITPETSIDEINNILKEFNIEKNLLNQILYIISMHDNKYTFETLPLELQIVQDADLLESIGARGLKRVLVYCKNKNIPLYNEKLPLNTQEYVVNINPISATHYIYRTLLQDAKYIKTQTAKILATNETSVPKKFIEKIIKKYNLKIN